MGENNTDKQYLAFKSELIKAYSQDPERQKKWKIEGLTDIISIAKKPLKSQIKQLLSISLRVNLKS